MYIFVFSRKPQSTTLASLQSIDFINVDWFVVSILITEISPTGYIYYVCLLWLSICADGVFSVESFNKRDESDADFTRI